MEEEAVVISVSGQHAKVRLQRGTSCDSCGSKASCATASGEEKDVDVINEAGAAPGQRVIIAVNPGVLLKASLTVYMLPLVALIGGAILGSKLAESMGAASQADAWAAATGFGLMILVFVGQKLWNRMIASNSQYTPRIIEIK